MKRVLLFVALLLVLPLVSADLVLTQPQSLYNRGDAFSIGVTVLSQTNANGFLTMTLGCPGYAVEIYRTPAKVEAGKEVMYQISSAFDSFLLGNFTGVCSVRAEFNGQSSTSKEFEVSRDIDVSVNAKAGLVSPGSVLSVSGNAQKKNGQQLNGFVEISVPDFSFSTLSSVNNGAFNSTIILPSDAKSGEHEILVNAYDKDSSGEILNSGNANLEFSISQIVSKVDVALNGRTLVPGDEVLFTAIVYDQAGDTIDTSAHVRLADASGNNIIDRVVASGEAQSYILLGNATPGSWIVSVALQNYSSSDSFSVDAVEKVNFELVNSTLVVTNQGNVPYSKPVEVAIGESSEVIQIDLQVNEVKRFKLGAPDGEYTIEIRQGSKTESLGSAFLTGNAVSVSDRDTIGSSISWIWLIILVALGIAAVYYYNKISNKDHVSRSPNYEIVKPSGDDTIQHGEKQKAYSVALTVKNFDELKGKDSTAKSALKSIIENARSQKINVSQMGNTILFVLSSSLIKKDELAIFAVLFANKIIAEISEHNSKYAQKIIFGVGVHTGEIIAEVKENQFKFHALGNIVSFAKKMSEKADSSVYISNLIHSESRARVKVEKIAEGNYWKVSSINERKGTNEFIERFKQRQN